MRVLKVLVGWVVLVYLVVLFLSEEWIFWGVGNLLLFIGLEGFWD